MTDLQQDIYILVLVCDTVLHNTVANIYCICSDLQHCNYSSKPSIRTWLCYCDLDLATEASDDDGLPHTLEHLIFLGSEDYPFKVYSV